MRPDMKSVIIDRPRTGGDGGKSIPPKGTKKRLQKTPLDEQPKHESTARRRAYGSECKELNEHLSPLRRWLESQVGRNWDEVWSEICAGLSIKNATTAHVRDHADDYVEKNCIIGEDGEICESNGLSLHGSYGRWKRFYVDPRTNTLQLMPEAVRKHYRKNNDWVKGKDAHHRYYLLNGIWYEVEMKPFPGARRRVYGHVNYNFVYDVVIAATWEGQKKYTKSSEQDCRFRHKEAIYAASKRQLSKRDIRKLKLWDTV